MRAHLSRELHERCLPARGLFVALAKANGGVGAKQLVAQRIGRGIVQG
jgi:hypothetical protein